MPAALAVRAATSPLHNASATKKNLCCLVIECIEPPEREATTIAGRRPRWSPRRTEESGRCSTARTTLDSDETRTLERCGIDPRVAEGGPHVPEQVEDRGQDPRVRHAATLDPAPGLQSRAGSP